MDELDKKIEGSIHENVKSRGMKMLMDILSLLLSFIKQSRWQKNLVRRRQDSISTLFFLEYK
jgi:hypothetical protein